MKSDGRNERDRKDGTGKQKVESGVQRLLDRGHRFFEHDMWHIDLAGVPTFRAIGIKITRLLNLAWQGMVQNDCLTRASALTYITVLSLVPLLAFGFSVAKGMGAYEKLKEEAINPFLDQLTPDGVVEEAPADGVLEKEVATEGAATIRDVAEKLLGFVEDTDFAKLGLVGFAFLILAALKMMTKIESSMNVIWGVQRSRSIIRKVTDFVALLVVTPILILLATALTTGLQNNTAVSYLSEDLGLSRIVALAFALLSLAFVWIGFGFLYVIMPNTRVPLRSAIIGGIVGGTLWQIFQVMHVQFQVGVANYNKIYAGFAAIPIFLVYVYMNWVAVLLGALVAWAHQVEPSYREHKRMSSATLADRELIALRALLLVGREFAAGHGVAELSAVAAYCNVPPGVLQEILEPLVRRRVIARTDDGRVLGFIPARELNDIRVSEILFALRGESHRAYDGADGASQTLEALRRDIAAAPSNVTLRSLLNPEAAAAQAAVTPRTS